MPASPSSLAPPRAGRRTLLVLLTAPLVAGPLLLAARGVQGAQDTVTPDEVQVLVDRLLAQRAERRALEEETAAERESLGADIARLQDDLELTRARVEALAAERARTAARERSARELAAQVEQGLDGLASRAAETAEAARAAVSAGIPFVQGDRSARLDASALEGTPSERARALVGLLVALGEELRLGETIEQRSDEVDLPDGRRVHAYVVRIGLLREAFVSEDGETVGLSTAEGAWRTDLDDETRANVEALVEMARGRRAAGLVAVPLSEGGS